jgi:hypothetical protein
LLASADTPTAAPGVGKFSEQDWGDSSERGHKVHRKVLTCINAL